MPPRLIRLFTLGYQGISLGNYVETLRAAGVGVVLDVREKAWSYKRGFSKSQLERALADADIDYVHVKSAGNPKANRATATSTEECLARYRVHLAENPGCLDELLDHARSASNAGRPACLTCFEQEPEDCHRSILAEELVRLAPRIATTHLGGG